MRSVILIAAAGLTGLVTATAPAQAHWWGYDRPYYPVPYGYYPRYYYAPPPPPVYEPPIYDPPVRRPYRLVRRIRHRHSPRRTHTVRRALVNPLLGPLR